MKISSLVFLFGLLVTVTNVWAVSMAEKLCPSPELGIQTEHTEKNPATEEEFKSLYDQAECLRRAAATKGAEWLETENLLKSSQEEAAEGNKETALELVKEAHYQALQALQQAEFEAAAWKRRVIK